MSSYLDDIMFVPLEEPKLEDIEDLTDLKTQTEFFIEKRALAKRRNCEEQYNRFLDKAGEVAKEHGVSTYQAYQYLEEKAHRSCMWSPEKERFSERMDLQRAEKEARERAQWQEFRSKVRRAVHGDLKRLEDMILYRG